jgi:hypothetical protein
MMGGATGKKALAGMGLGILMAACRGAEGSALGPAATAPSASLKVGADGSTNAAPAKGSAGMAAAAAALAAATLEEDGVAFVLAVGTTFRWKGWLDVYDVELRLGPGTLREKPLAGGAVRLEFKYHRPFSAKQVADGGNALLEKNVTPDEWKALPQPRLRLGATRGPLHAHPRTRPRPDPTPQRQAVGDGRGRRLWLQIPPDMAGEGTHPQGAARPLAGRGGVRGAEIGVAARAVTGG